MLSEIIIDAQKYKKKRDFLHPNVLACDKAWGNCCFMLHNIYTVAFYFPMKTLDEHTDFSVYVPLKTKKKCAVQISIWLK